MSSMKTRSLVVLVAVAVAALLAGCGGGSKTVKAPNTPKQIAADKAVAEKAVLQLSDLPAGYKGSPHDSSGSDKIPNAVAAKFGTCAHMPAAEITKLMNGDHQADQPSANSQDFALTGSSALTQTSISNTVELDRSSKDLSDPLDLFGASRALPCWKDLFQAAFNATAPSGGSIKGLSVFALPTKSLGDQAAAFEARVDISTSASVVPVTVTAYLDLYFVRRGRAGVTLLGSGIGTRIPPTLERSLVQKVLDRLDAAT